MRWDHTMSVNRQKWHVNCQYILRMILSFVDDPIRAMVGWPFRSAAPVMDMLCACGIIRHNMHSRKCTVFDRNNLACCCLSSVYHQCSSQLSTQHSRLFIASSTAATSWTAWAGVTVGCRQQLGQEHTKSLHSAYWVSGCWPILSRPQTCI